MKLLAITLLNLGTIITVVGVWKFIVKDSFKMRLLCAWRIMTIKHYHLMTKNKDELIQHVSSAYGEYNEKWLEQSGQRIDSVIEDWDKISDKQRQEWAVEEVRDILNSGK